MALSEEAKVRLMVIPIVAMLAVTMIVAGWQQSEEQEIDVEEGYDETTVEVPHPDENMEFPDKKFNRATAISYVNGDMGNLEIDVFPRSWSSSSERYLCEIVIDVKGNFSSELNPEELILEAQVVEAPGLEGNSLDWDTSYWESDGLELWSPVKMKTGSVGEEMSFIGSDIHEDRFNASVQLSYRHPSNYTFVERPITIEFRAVLTGHAEEIKVISRVSFTQMEVESK